VEEGSNTSTVALASRRRRRKGSIESETVKYDYESNGARDGK
jgi:hypothetical protein